MYQYVATFHNTKGRYAVNRNGFGYEGQRILDRRQLKYGNKPDAQGLFLDEMFRSFGANEVKSLKPIK